MVSVEILRATGRFEGANENLHCMPVVSGKDDFYQVFQALVRLQEKLIKDKDSGIHHVPWPRCGVEE
jgi:hypothetical protein